MNNDLISRKALLEAYDKAHQGPPGGARKLIEEAPGVDAVEVVHVEWVKRGYKWQCTHCGVRMSIDGTPEDNLLHYCPNCGAKMDGRKEK